MAAICIALLPYRLIAIGALLAFAAIRLVWEAIIFHWWRGFVLGLAAGAAVLILVQARLVFKGDYSIPYKFEPYSVAEFVIDILVFLLMLGLIRELIT